MARRVTPLAGIVRARRQDLHLTQQQLAERVGVSRSEISEIEAGRVRHPRAGVFASLGRVLGLPAAALLAAVGYAATEIVGLPPIDIEEADELLVLGSLLAQMSAPERRWLRERLREVEQLVLLRKRATARPARPRSRRT